MVLAVLVNRIAPSSRGLLRSKANGAGNRVHLWTTTSDAQHDISESYRNLDDMVSHRNQPTKRKPFKAIALLTSFASDLDVVSDWLFYRDTLSNDQEFRNNNHETFLIPPILLTILFMVCVTGTIMWLILATDGRLLTPLLKRLGVEKMSMGHMLFLCVVLEDVPQIILTFLVEDYYEEAGGLSNFAVMNLTVSAFDVLIKIAEAYDERNDVVETGVFCKKSLWAHKDTVTAVLALPLPPSNKNTALRPALSTRASSRHRKSLIERAMKPVAPTELPRVRFLTTSLDKTIRLWDTAITKPGRRRQHCVRTFSGHLDGVTCIALLGKSEGYDVVHPEHEDAHVRDEEHDLNTFFITGCKSGNAKMWNLNGDCIRSFYPLASSQPNNGIASLNVVKQGSTFVCGHMNGTVRLWEAWSGVCIAEYKGHNQTVSALCSLNDEKQFLTGSHDETIKLWDVTAAMKALSDYKPSDQTKNNGSLLANCSLLLTETALCQETMCQQSFGGHSGAILALACIEKGLAFVSGSADGTARLWSVQNQSCLRIFSEHLGPVQSVAVLDQMTLLSGSDDATVKVWSVFSAISLRTYEGHTDHITSVSLCDNGTTFLSSSADCTVKVWVLSTIQEEEDDSDEDDDLFDLNDLSCGRGKLVAFQKGLNKDCCFGASNTINGDMSC